MEQTLILVDRNDNVLGYAPRSVCHEGEGKLHRAVAIILFNSEGEILLQRRKSLLWDDFWDITAATHTLHHDGRDEPYADAAERCLRDEWNVSTVVEPVFSFVYFEPFNGFCETEYCVLFVGKYDGPISFNPSHAYDMRWIGVQECRADIQQEESRYTPWACIAVEHLVRHLPLERLTAS